MQTMVMGGSPLVLDLVGARVKMSMLGANGIGTGIIAGAITQSDINTKVYPQMQVSLAAQVAKDCTNTTPPQCGCAAGSTGLTILNLFDTAPKDCAVTLAEVQSNTLFQSLLAPDVTINGMPAISLGVKVTAVRAGFVP
jgi:hypothetical protein